MKYNNLNRLIEHFEAEREHCYGGPDPFRFETVDSALKMLIRVKTVLEMVEDNTKMPHQHKDYYERLCCLAERAREVLEGDIL
jgi:hypothetical protein